MSIGSALCVAILAMVYTWATCGYVFINWYWWRVDLFNTPKPWRYLVIIGNIILTCLWPVWVILLLVAAVLKAVVMCIMRVTRIWPTVLKRT
jgi:hypothetical protein